MVSMLRQVLTRFSAANNSLCLHKSNVVFTLPLFRFSTSGESQSAAHPTVYELLVHKHHFSPESASKIASAVARLRNAERSDSVLSFLQESGFSNSQLEKMVNRRPRLLSLNLENIIKPQFKIFHAFGLSASDITNVISRYPNILALRYHKRLMSSLSTLQSLFGANGFTKLLGVSGWFLIANLDDTLVPNVEFLRKCGISMDQIIQMACRRPKTLLCKPDDMKKFVERADEMGVSKSSKMFSHAVVLSHSMLNESWNLKERTFRELGFSDDDITVTFRKFPNVFGLLEKTLKRKVETFREMGFLDDDVASALRKSPQLLGFSEEILKLRVLTFKEMGLSNDDIAATFRKFPPVFGLSKETWKHKVKTFGEMGLSNDDIAATCRKFPPVFCLSKETWKHKVKTFGEMGLSDDDIASALRKYPTLFGYSDENLKHKVRTLKEMGFSDGDIVASLKKSPSVFGLSVEKVKRTKEVLLENGKYNLSCIIRNPASLGYSIEKRYKPRLQVLELLEGKNLIQRWPPFTTFFTMTDQKFDEKYVTPFLAEIRDDYVEKSASRG